MNRYASETQGKQGNGTKIRVRLWVSAQALSRLLWVNSSLHVGPIEKNGTDLNRANARDLIRKELQ